MPVPCQRECGSNAVLKRPKTGHALCKECFFIAFETEIHFTITKSQLFKPGDSVAIGASGGKDSTVLAYVLKKLNQQYNYGLKLLLLSIDEGITGYRDDSLETVKQNRDDYEMPLKILSYKDLYGWTMDEIVAQIGKKNNCTFCGVFRRQALDRGAAMLGVQCIATGHNADDIAETVLMNVMRGDIARLKRCTAISTGSEGTIPRVKPLKYTYEKEIVMYAHFKKLVYFSTECVFSPEAFRGHARALLKDLERVRPSCIMDIIYSGETITVKEKVSLSLPSLRTCSRCNFVSSQEVCKACVLLEGLNKGLPKLGIGKSSKAKRMLDEYNARNKKALEQAVNELDGDSGTSDVKSCKSKGRPCRTGLCRSKKTESNSKGEKDLCCGGSCKENKSNEVCNSKINTLLQEFSIGDDKSDKIPSNVQNYLTNTKNKDEHLEQSNSKENDENSDYESASESEEIKQTDMLEDEDACVGSCGKGGALVNF